MSVPTSWWPDYDGNDLNDGVIHAVDFTVSNQRYFQLLLDTDKDDAEEDDNLRGLYYPMRYDAVFLYAKDDQSQWFRLPRHQVPMPDGEQVRMRRHAPTNSNRNRNTDEDGTASTASVSSKISDNSSASGKSALASEGTHEEIEWHNMYEWTDPSDWKCLQNGSPGQQIDPIPYTGESEEFSVKITEDEVKELMDENSDIRFHKVLLEWTLPRF